MIIAFVIANLFAFMFLCTVFSQEKKIKELKEELTEKGKAVTYYRHVIEGFHEKMKEEEEKYEILSATYCTSDSDLIKYNSDKCMQNVIRNKIAMTISNDILKRFDLRVLPLGDGKEKYSLVLKVKKI